jgi:hypothetical protein
MVVLILDRQTVYLSKLKGSVGKFLGNTQTDSRSHYQRIKRCFLKFERKKPSIIIMEIVKPVEMPKNLQNWYYQPDRVQF